MNSTRVLSNNLVHRSLLTTGRTLNHVSRRRQIHKALQEQAEPLEKPLNRRRFVATQSSTPISPSSLHVSGRYGNKMIQIIKPHIDLDETLYKLPQIRDSIDRRGMTAQELAHIDLDQLSHRIRQLIAARQELSTTDELLTTERSSVTEQLKSGRPADQVDRARLGELKALHGKWQQQTWDLEETVIPEILSLPGLLSESVAERQEEKILMSKSRTKLARSFKMLDHVKLSYINESVYGSIAGPGAVYHLGQAAKLHMLAAKGFGAILRRNNFVDVTGLDFIKSAVIEATRSKKERHYQSDPLRIDRGSGTELYSQQMHLVGPASLEALAAALVKLLPSTALAATTAAGPTRQPEHQHHQQQRTVAAAENSTNDRTTGGQRRAALPVTRLFVAGSANYQPRASLPSQQLVMQAVSAAANADDACREMNHILQLLWCRFFEQLDLSCQALAPGPTQLAHYESDARLIGVWMPSRNDYVECVRISYFADHLPNRLGLSGLHLVGSYVNCSALIAALIENFQSEDGKIVIPEPLINANWC